MSLMKFTWKGQDYPLAHLRGFRVVVPAKDPLQRSAVLQVTFSCHVYSQKWDAALHDEADRFEEDGQQRCFCPVRYGCSLKLEQAISGHVGGKAFRGRDGGGFWNNFFYSVADGVPYPIYFRLGKADRINGVDGLMHIISAYQNPNLQARHRFQAINFARLVHTECKPKSK
jgi:hypothetical protein